MARRLFRPGLTCHYCGTYSRDNQAGITRAWLCPHCESMNYVDEKGGIVDPPVEDTAPRFVRYAHSRSPSPQVSTAKDAFCKSCQRNQLLVNKAMAEYLPDDDDPDYTKYEASVDAFRDELERRYPPVCDKCVHTVQKQIRAAQYTANTDHLRRILQFSKRNRAQHDTTKQAWLLRVVFAAKWIYYASVAVGIVWHLFGIMLQSDTGSGAATVFDWPLCLEQALTAFAVERFCFNSPPVMLQIKYTLVADLLTFWWNPQLETKINRAGGRMRGLTSQWLLRLVVVAVRYGIFYRSQDPSAYNGNLQFFRVGHAISLAFVIAATLLSRQIVYIDYQSTKTFMKRIDPYLPQATSREGTQEPYQPARPKYDSFDTMAQSFTESFPISNPGEATGILNDQYPPSPTESISSFRDDDSDVYTPYLRKAHVNKTLNDDMDWTPTRRTFAPPQQILPPVFSQAPSAPPPRQPHSIFAKPSTNPFDRRVPAPPPKHKEHERRNPWKPSIFQPATQSAKKNFFAEVMNSQGSPTTQESLRQAPSWVRKDEELFEPPKLKYDTYTKPKMTGLEDTFNSLFSG
ncbi:uncharacterized protein BDR25DRAFT_267847 [Lindgomyces ingoldianus]|uniref:Uncharacterized protein n=1 Tax=Lindgomyces ingoldianus TaxID=673940 RepID=A0ACB6QLP8_9PLEO|nr:uncharacterized protein BDR25DRAFT_267847 [Lindgomyces ingoldianus]KAF2467045.1 hypothetical protein BDR25DRAFT_267847 [Lindgomyces ingoldianus]